ncbi:MAG: gliding motility-associated C-terminal domain-containing protein [Bacteroidales bacterium]|jgi:gliding motility-associated-like protein|nr:gliding motility-associated C-terminal domain-containing protein [Bacteroidales bacterium]
MKRLSIILIFSALLGTSYATHNRAGEITYVQLSDLTYEITITTFTYVLSQADRDFLDVDWGDGTMSTAVRVFKGQLPNYYQKNIYKVEHTYPGTGIYKIVVQDPNRNYGINNIPNSVNVVFSISTILMVNPGMGMNSTPVLLNPPYDKAALGYKFIHNPGAYDPDGDSLSYKLTICTKEDGKPIENYSFPPTSNVFYVDSLSGDLVWDAPNQLGTYNVAMEINEWRNNIKIGTVVRDMQIEVYETDNNPPENSPLSDFCVEAGETIEYEVSATDEDNDLITLLSTSGIYTLSVCPASFNSIDSGPGFATSLLSWTPCHESVRNQPYDVLIKAEDNNEDLQLFDLDNFSIKVLGPAPTLTSASPTGKYIRLNWELYVSDYIEGYNIYRRVGATDFQPDSCTNGIPDTYGFEKVGFAGGASTVSFIDTNDGEGLESGTEYAYRIVAVYPNGTESKVSNEITSALITGVPLITNVSVTNTSVTDGEIFVAWAKPDQLDTIPAAGPYEYIIYRSEGHSGNDFIPIDSIQTTDLNDTTFIDSQLNTLDQGYIYRIALYNDSPGDRFLIGEPGVASSLFLELSPGDRKARFVINRNVPWVNYRYDIFRWNQNTSLFDSIASTNLLEFTDTGLENGIEYCYYVRSEGAYQGDGLPDKLLNLSQEACVIPIDNEPPCTPALNVTTNCDSLYNNVTWSVDDPECFEDIAGYRLFYKNTFEGDLGLLRTFDNRNILEYRHYPGEIVAGCYAILAFDEEGNESPLSVVICVDSCNFYEIPNVFTPNNDGKNDILRARTTGLVEKVDFKLFNRGGLLIFQTEEPRLNWNGTYKGAVVKPGVYFYRCDVYERRITGLEEYSLSGFVHVITEKGAEAVTIEYK